MKIAMIPAAGSSTRFRELGKQYAKTVLPFEGRPIICHIIEGLESAHQFDRFYIVVNNKLHLEQIDEALNSLHIDRTRVEIVQIDERFEALRPGPGLTITLGAAQIPYEDYELFVHLSDSLFDYSLVAQMKPGDVSYQMEADSSRWCIADDSGPVIKYHDKQSIPGSHKALSGLYYFAKPPTEVKANADGETQISGILQLIKNTRLVEVPILKDFGTIAEYNACRGISKTRSFNRLEDCGGYVKKSGTNAESDAKVDSEATWYLSLPVSMKRYAPAVYETSFGSVSMEKICSTNLRDLALYLDRSENTWNEVFDSVNEFLDSALIPDNGGQRFLREMVSKTWSRSQILPAGIGDKKEIATFVNDLSALVDQAPHGSRLIHGDLHFANMFYDFNYKRLQLVDPRGALYGSQYYDIAKLYQSAISDYDWIDAELYVGDKLYNKGREGIAAAFQSKILSRYSDFERRLIRQLAASLFLSMIPLHSHNRKNQELFYQKFLELK